MDGHHGAISTLSYLTVDNLPEKSACRRNARRRWRDHRYRLLDMSDQAIHLVQGTSTVTGSSYSRSNGNSLFLQKKRREIFCVPRGDYTKRRPGRKESTGWDDCTVCLRGRLEILVPRLSTIFRRCSLSTIFALSSPDNVNNRLRDQRRNLASFDPEALDGLTRGTIISRRPLSTDMDLSTVWKGAAAPHEGNNQAGLPHPSKQC